MPDETLNQERSVPEGTKQITKYTAEHGREVGLPSPEAINYMMSVASLLVNTALVGKDMGLSKDQIAELRNMGWTPEQIEERHFATVKSNALSKMLVGHELNPPIPPLAALQEIDIVKAKIFLRYPHLITQMEAKGYEVEEIERTHERAAIRVTKNGKPQEFEFTIEDAKRAGLTNSYQSGEKSQYEKRPRVMLWARVVSEAYRATGGRGGVYETSERREIEDNEDRGDGSSTAFADHAKDKEKNPFHVGTTAPATASPDLDNKPSTKAADAPVTETKQEPEVATKPVIVTPPPSSAPPPPSEEQPKDNVVEMPKAASSPTAAAAAPAPAPKPAAHKPLKEQLIEMTDLLPNISPETLKRKTFPEFLRGFLNVSKLPETHPQYVYAVPLLGSILRDNPQKFLQDAHGMGVESGAGWRELDKWMKTEMKWPEDCYNLAVAIAIERFSYNPQDLVEYFDQTVHIGNLDVEDTRAFLAVLAKTKQAMLLVETSVQRNTSIAEIVRGWKVDLLTQSEDQILALLGPGVAPKQADAPPPPTEEADDNDILGLFDEEDAAPVEDEPSA